MKRSLFGVLIFNFIFAIFAIALLFPTNATLASNDSCQAIGNSFAQSGLTNYKKNNVLATDSTMSENTSGSITYLQITIPVGATDITLKQTIAGSDYTQTADEQPAPAAVAAGTTLLFTRSALYTLSYTLSSVTNTYSCNFTPVLKPAAIKYDTNKTLLSKSGDNYYALNAAISFNMNYKADLFTAVSQDSALNPLTSIDNNKYDSAKITYKSIASEEVFTLDFTILTVQFKLTFYDLDDDLLNTELTSVWNNTDIANASSYNYQVFNQGVKVKIQLANSLGTNTDNLVLSLFNFNVTPNQTLDPNFSFNSDTMVYDFDEVSNNTYEIVYGFKEETAQTRTISNGKFKIITVLPSSATLFTKFQNNTVTAPGDYDFIKDYFKSSKLSSKITNITSEINSACVWPVVFNIENGTKEPGTDYYSNNYNITSGKSEWVKVVSESGQTYVYYSYLSASRSMEDSFAFRFKLNVVDTGTDELFSCISMDPTQYPGGTGSAFDPSIIPEFDSITGYVFDIDYSTYVAHPSIRITYNGIVYDYKFTKDEQFKFSAPGDYIVEFYAFNDYETMTDAWSAFNIADYTQYQNSKNYTDITNPYPAIKRSFTIKGSFTTATYNEGKSYLFNNQIVSSNNIKVKVHKSNPTISYKVFFNNIETTEGTETIATTGSTFSKPGLWTIKIFDGPTIKDIFSFTIVATTYQTYSFYSNPATNKNLTVTSLGKTITSENDYYHISDTGEYTVKSTYSSVFNLKNTASSTYTLQSDTESRFTFEIKPSKFGITLATGENGSKITEDVQLSSISSDIKATKLDVYVNGKLLKTFDSNQIEYFAQVSDSDKKFTENGIYTFVLYDEYGNSYQLQIEKYYKMNTATVILIVLGSVSAVVITFIIIKVRRKVTAK